MKKNRFIYLPLCLLILLALACGISINSAPAQPTTDLLGTINAAVAVTETAQKDAQATAEAASTATSQVASPTATLIPTDSPEALPSLTPSPAATAPDSVYFKEWSMQYFVQLSGGCKVKNALCWKTDDDYSKHFGNPMIMTSKTSVLIEPSWPSPYLVFWHKRDIKHGGSLEIGLDGKYLKVKDFSSSNSDWNRVFIKLSDYKGKELTVRFSADGMLAGSGRTWSAGRQQSIWFIQEIQVIPDFIPPS